MNQIKPTYQNKALYLEFREKGIQPILPYQEVDRYNRKNTYLGKNYLKLHPLYP